MCSPGSVVTQRSPIEGSLNFAITNSCGAILVLFGIALVYGRTGALNLAQIGQALAHHHVDGLVVVGFSLIVCGFLVKAAAVPFHFWLADAYAVAPTPVCILFAGAMSELGLLGVARVYWTSFHGALGAHDAELRTVLVTVGIVTALVGALMTLGQHHLKRLLAFATVSYMGLFLVGVGLLSADGLGGVAVYVVGDGFVKAALFVCVGILQHRRASVDEVELHGRGRGLPLTGAVFLLGSLAVAGLPPFGPFLGKALVEDAASKQGYGWLPPLMMIAAALSAGAILRAGVRVFLGLGARGHEDQGSRAGREESGPETEQATDRTPAIMWVPARGADGRGHRLGADPRPDAVRDAGSREVHRSRRLCRRRAPRSAPHRCPVCRPRRASQATATCTERAPWWAPGSSPSSPCCPSATGGSARCSPSAARSARCAGCTAGMWGTTSRG